MFFFSFFCTHTHTDGACFCRASCMNFYNIERDVRYEYEKMMIEMLRIAEKNELRPI